MLSKTSSKQSQRSWSKPLLRCLDIKRSKSCHIYCILIVGAIYFLKPHTS